MYRFYWVIFINLFRVPAVLTNLEYMAKHKENYSEEKKIKAIKSVIRMIRHSAHIHTKVYGAEKLPEEGGYIMYANHQGKWDALGIFDAQTRLLSVVMDEAKSYVPLTKQVIDLCNGKRLVLNDPRSGVKIIGEMAEEAEAGRSFLIFPEGGYNHNHNNLQEFKAGSFKASLKSKTPIVPVALVDSYKAFEGIRIGVIKTEVHFLDPIPYEEFKDMKTPEIAEMVKGQIEDKINSVLAERKQKKKNYRRQLRSFFFNKEDRD
ncbi:MAG: 1-acyl-sn-glycerol-3-phosphate acyltransferase [Lachnospiraceae bacterium]|nr:1-acyl-sn-glycerol-3-phosphate acyltransferase [Lachnospiraceae bacterium]